MPSRKEVTSLEDSQIIALYFQRNEQAIAETASKYGRYCFCITMNVLGNREDAEEAVSDTYLAVWSTIPPHKPIVFSTFLGKIARYTAIKRWQKNTAQKRSCGLTVALEELAECISDRGNAETALENAQLTRILNDFLRKLPKQERMVFVCRYWYVDSIEEIAGRFGFTQSKVKSMLARTRKKLKATLQKEGIAI